MTAPKGRPPALFPLFAAIDAFNRDAVRTAGEVAHWRSRQALLPDRDLHRRDQATRDGVGPLLAWYAVADSLALAAQRKHRLALTAQIALILLTTYLVRLALQLPGENWWAGAAYG